jgi:hypothetical protein
MSVQYCGVYAGRARSIASAPALRWKFSDPAVIDTNWLAATRPVSAPLPAAVRSEERLAPWTKAPEKSPLGFPIEIVFLTKRFPDDPSTPHSFMPWTVTFSTMPVAVGSLFRTPATSPL